MANKSHFNKGHLAINSQRKNGISHSSYVVVSDRDIKETLHAVFIVDAVEALKRIPDNAIQLVLINPPYNLDLDY